MNGPDRSAREAWITGVGLVTALGADEATQWQGLGDTAARARALLNRLEAAILAKAFRGELVPQDPNDEPASVLLDRIHAQRAAAPKSQRGRKRAAAATA